MEDWFLVFCVRGAGRGPGGAGGAPTIDCDRDRLERAMTFIVSSERDGGEVQGPHAIVDFLERDAVAGEWRRDEERRAAPGDAAVAAHEADFHVSGILDRRHARGQLPRRRRVATGWRLVVQRLVRPLIVVLANGSAKALLLRGAALRPPPRGFGLLNRVK